MAEIAALGPCILEILFEYALIHSNMLNNKIKTIISNKLVAILYNFH